MEDPPFEIQDVVSYILSHRLQQKRLAWPTCPLPTTPPSKVCLVLKSLVDDFRSRNEDRFQEMFEESQFERDPAATEAAFLFVVSELFRQGIKWVYIIALFVLGGELAVVFASRNWPEMLDHLKNWMINYINTHLQTWIQEHGGWEYIIHHYGEEEKSVDPTWPRIKNWVYGAAAGALGVLTLKAILASKP